jgi:hypothetical protein
MGRLNVDAPSSLEVFRLFIVHVEIKILIFYNILILKERIKYGKINIKYKIYILNQCILFQFDSMQKLKQCNVT